MADPVGRKQATHFTGLELGNWIKVKPHLKHLHLYSNDTLQTMMSNKRVDNEKGHYTYSHNGLQICALRFSDGTEWDCINGWRP